MNGELFPDEAARVSVFDHGLVTGDGVFETIKVTDGVPFALTRHLVRLGRSATGLGLAEPDLDQIRDGARMTTAAINQPNADLRRRKSWIPPIRINGNGSNATMPWSRLTSPLFIIAR